MKILIDGTYYQNGIYHGGGEYGNVILDKLLHIDDRDFGIIFYQDLKTDNTKIPACIEKGWEIFPISGFHEVPRILSDNNYDVFYSPLPYQDNRTDIKLPNNVKYIATIHGLRTIELLDYIGITNNNPNSIWEWEDVAHIYRNYIDAFAISDNRCIIAISEHTKYSIYNTFPELENEPIEVLYSPQKLTPPCCDNEEEALSSIKLQKDNYALMVSADVWYKNVPLSLIAYDQIFSMNYSFINSDYKVVVTGVADVSEILSQLENKDRFVLLDYVDSSLLETLYKNAHLFVFPSLNEGFGYPPMEAMKYGTLCACAASSSITEVCHDMVLYFNPVMINEIKNRILQSFNPDIRAMLSDRIQQVLPEVQRRQKEDLDKLICIIISGGAQ